MANVPPAGRLGGMANLDYQRPDDARRELRSDFWFKLFGISKSEAWAALAREINARHEQGGWWKGDRVVAEVGNWQITLDTYTESNGETSTTYTRMRAPYVNADGFRFRIYRASIFTGLGKLLGMQDLEIGDRAFDEQFVIQSNNPTKVVQFLSNPRLRGLIMAQPRMMFQVRDDEGWFGTHFPQGVDEIYFRAHGVIKDLDRLRGLFDLFGETLFQLRTVGSAHHSPPGVTL
jgi:hypothetical protein